MDKKLFPTVCFISEPKYRTPMKNASHPSSAICAHLVLDKDLEETMRSNGVLGHPPFQIVTMLYIYLCEVTRAGLALVTSTEVPFVCKGKRARGIFEPENSFYISLLIIELNNL